VRIDTIQIDLPSQVLAVYLTQVCNEESIFTSHLASIIINVINALSERLSDQCMRCMVEVVVMNIQIVVGQDGLDRFGKVIRRQN
jgi:hypothetical protein